MAERESSHDNKASRERGVRNSEEACEPCKTFGQKCSHIVKKQRAKFYILRRCIAMLVCWRDRSDS